MSVQASADSLGGDKYPFNREHIEVVLEEEGFLSVKLGGYCTEVFSENVVAVDAELNSNTDALLSLYGIESARWRDHVEKVEADHMKDISGMRMRSLPGYDNAGEALHILTFLDMPMEGEVDGEGGVKIIINADDDHTIELSGTGSYWRDRFYTHPVTQEKVSTRSLDAGGYKELWSHGEPEYLDYEDHHEMIFDAVIYSALESALKARASA